MHFKSGLNTGQNVSHLLKMYELNNVRTLIKEKQVIKNKRIHTLPEDESWKVEMIEEMCLTKMGFIEADEEEKHIKTFLEIICTE